MRLSLTDKSITTSEAAARAPAIAGTAHIYSWDTHMRRICIIAQLSYFRRATKTLDGLLPSAFDGPAGATHPSWNGRQQTTLRTNFFSRAPRCSTGDVPNAHKSPCFAICRGTTHTVR